MENQPSGLGDLERYCTRDSMRYFIRKSRDSPWGDYGSILANGRGRRADDGTLIVDRCGPFVPTIFVAGFQPVFTNDAKQRLEASEFSGFSFRAAKLGHIAKSNWHEWDWTAPDPRFFPPNGEPESYILNEPHCHETATQIGQRWELLGETDDCDQDFVMVSGTINKIIVTERAKQFLSEMRYAIIRFHATPDGDVQ